MKSGENYLKTVQEILGGELPRLSVPITVFVDKQNRRFRTSRYGIRDWAGLVQLYLDFEPKASAGGLPPTDEPQIRAWLQKLTSEGFNILAKNRERVVAHAVLSPLGEHRAEVAVFVHQDFRGVGLGGKLVTCLVAIAKIKHFERVWALVESENGAIIHINQALGFMTYRISQGSIEMELKLREIQ